MGIPNIHCIFVSFVFGRRSRTPGVWAPPRQAAKRARAQCCARVGATPARSPAGARRPFRGPALLRGSGRAEEGRVPLRRGRLPRALPEVRGAVGEVVCGAAWALVCLWGGQGGRTHCRARGGGQQLLLGSVPGKQRGEQRHRGRHLLDKFCGKTCRRENEQFRSRSDRRHSMSASASSFVGGIHHFRVFNVGGTWRPMRPHFATIRAFHMHVFEGGSEEAPAPTPLTGHAPSSSGRVVVG